MSTQQQYTVHATQQLPCQACNAYRVLAELVGIEDGTGHEQGAEDGIAAQAQVSADGCERTNGRVGGVK